MRRSARESFDLGPEIAVSWRLGADVHRHEGEQSYEQGYGQEERREEKAGKVSAGETRRQEGEETEPRVPGLRIHDRRLSANCRTAWFALESGSPNPQYDGLVAHPLLRNRELSAARDRLQDASIDQRDLAAAGPF